MPPPGAVLGEGGTVKRLPAPLQALARPGKLAWSQAFQSCRPWADPDHAGSKGRPR